MIAPDLAVLLVMTVVVAAGTAVQVLLGFGVNLLLVPAALLLWPGLVPVPAMIVNLVLSAGVALRWGRHADPVVTRWALIGAIPGLIVGVWLLAVLSPRALMAAGGTAILAAVLLIARPGRVPGARARPAAREHGRVSSAASVAAGAGSAVLATTAAVTGPPIALLLAGAEPRRARATVAMTGTLTALVALVVVLAGPVRSSVVESSAAVLWLLPGLAAGWFAGHGPGSRVSAPVLRRTVLGVSAASAIVVLLRAALL